MRKSTPTGMASAMSAGYRRHAFCLVLSIADGNLSTMGVLWKLVRAANRLTAPLGFRIEPVERPKSAVHPDLVSANPRLVELRNAYATCDRAVTASRQWHRWTISSADLQSFRGDTAYVWQRDGDASLAIGARYAIEHDPLGLLTRLREDGAFGARTIEIHGRLFSRDLVDSVLELTFLDRHLGLSGKRVLDIGAGYGRLAHRATEAFDVSWQCADAIPVSTFLSEFYLSYRGSSAVVTPLPDFSTDAEIVVNVHSFTECTLEAVDWWLSRVCSAKHLFLVPNAQEHGGTRLLTSYGDDLGPVLERHGFRLRLSEPKYADALAQQFAVQPTRYYLFDR